MISFREIEYSTDVPEIIDLIHLGLSDKNTEASFLWKHYENPFGKSLGLVACDQKKIVGVRMFMFWEFMKEGTIVKAIRPVDTIIHPDYRGKGLFKDLTMTGLAKFKDSYDLVFNTPNNNSLPGYIKMGWKYYEENLNFKFGIIFPSMSGEITVKNVRNGDVDISELSINNKGFKTNLSKEYLDWRYIDNDYQIVLINAYGASALVIFRLETLKGIKTLILIDYIGDQNLMKASLSKLAKINKVFLLYYLDNEKLHLRFSKRRGNSVVVYRDDNLKIIEDLQFSSGDLEGRL
ncbi:Acetyltransferase (GNAT) domain-containing protein [Gillisia sp. Hel1_33_143]|uniref:GNAT family N-acetyltransferase n=1 Tax=Gillisia sp. Hel1_33_143 TaxID=1336796 RepID=UPI00087A4ECC|nr:GNAT family N-acetyltransferase [Gillisia sp. Hel1_33_143]SDS79681.1 Acetyltransferase (GNAT) domain-containing protein [Gillisia sp. Hel1_33_143]